MDVFEVCKYDDFHQQFNEKFDTRRALTFLVRARLLGFLSAKPEA